MEYAGDWVWGGWERGPQRSREKEKGRNKKGKGKNEKESMKNEKRKENSKNHENIRKFYKI